MRPSGSAAGLTATRWESRHGCWTGWATWPGGRLVLALNNPYGAVVRRHVADYFDSGARDPYRGLWAAGIKAYYYHRTLEEYVEAFGAAGLTVTRLADLPAMASVADQDTILPPGGRFPRFMLLALTQGSYL